MSAEEEIAKELAKQLPVRAVYEDGLRSATKQAGGIAEDFAKVIRLALFPLQVGAVLQDRFRAFLERSVARVPEEKRIAPPPQILGPVFEAIRHEPEGTPIDRMFSELLSSAMDRERCADAHPAFPLIIKQLSADEAELLREIALSKTYFEIIMRFDLDKKRGLSITRLESTSLPKEALAFPTNEPMYRDHLERLGLIRYDEIRTMEPIVSRERVQTGGRNFLIIKLTDLGAALMRASGHPPLQSR